MSIRWVQRTPGSIAIVFVHGILSSGESCWLNKNGTYWPDLLASDLPHSNICVATYTTGIDAHSFSVNDIANSLFEELRHESVMQHGQIVFVCHSMGGLVARRMLVAKQGSFVNKQIGVFLVASPSLGSAYANWLAPIAEFLGHAQARALRMGESNEWLTTLDEDFFTLVEGFRIAGRELVEDQSIFRIGPLSLTQIVSPLSGERFFREPLRIGGTDHFSIAKPPNSEALQHKVLVEFIRSRFSSVTHSLRMRDSSQGGKTHEASAPYSLPVNVTTLASESVSGALSVESLLARESLVDYILAANEEELAALVASVPPGRGIEMAFVPDKFKRLYAASIAGESMGGRVANASALVRACSPQFAGRYHLVTIADGEFVQAGVPTLHMVYSAFQLAGLRGPRMLAAMIVEAPLPTLIGARNEAENMLRQLLIGGAS